jgi:hypothetical protein
MRIWKFIIAATAVFLQGCERDGGVIGKVRIGDIQGAFFIEDDERTTPLTRVRHSIYYAEKGTRSLIFEGTGGSKPTLSLLTPDTVLVRYCGGSIDHAASFLEGPPSGDSDLRIFQVQPITSVGVAADGRPIC